MSGSPACLVFVLLDRKVRDYYNESKQDKGEHDMQIRQLTAGERFDARRVSLIAFHERVNDLEAEREACERNQDEDWGAFDDDGTLMARIINNHYTVYLDGGQVQCGGIGAVSTLPEYRESGAIRSIFTQLLPEAYARGEVLSALYPFSHAFYRKFGYDTVCVNCGYSFEPKALRGYHFHGQVRQYRPGDDIAPYAALYSRFAAKFNLPAVRSEAMVQEHLKGVDHKDRKFTYLLSEDGRPVAYVTFQDVYHDPAAILSVLDFAWDGRVGFQALLGFLGRFTADYGLIRINMPMGIDLLSLLWSTATYDIKAEPRVGFMVRVIHVQKLLTAIRCPAGCRYTIRVTDEFIPQNNGTWHVSEEGAVLTYADPDLAVDVRALAQLAIGAISLDEAILRTDVELHSNEDVLRQVFVRKPLYMAEHF